MELNPNAKKFIPRGKRTVKCFTDPSIIYKYDRKSPSPLKYPSPLKSFKLNSSPRSFKLNSSPKKKSKISKIIDNYKKMDLSKKKVVYITKSALDKSPKPSFLRDKNNKKIPIKYVTKSVLSKSPTYSPKDY